MQGEVQEKNPEVLVVNPYLSSRENRKRNKVKRTRARTEKKRNRTARKTSADCPR